MPNKRDFVVSFLTFLLTSGLTLSEPARSVILALLSTLGGQ